MGAILGTNPQESPRPGIVDEQHSLVTTLLCRTHVRYRPNNLARYLYQQGVGLFSRASGTEGTEVTAAVPCQLSQFEESQVKCSPHLQSMQTWWSSQKP